MASIVFGLGASHSPAINMEPAAWLVRGEHDKRSTMLRDFNGKPCRYEDLLKEAAASILDEIKPEKLQARHEATQRAVATAAQAITDARLDVLVMFGDDHWEVYTDENMPALAVYWGDTIPYRQQGILKWPYEESMRTDMWYPDEPREYPVHSELGRHLIQTLMAQDFDIAHSRKIQRDRGMSHSYAFVFHRLLCNHELPTVPIHINTYFPPNQPSPARCFRLGQAVRKAVEAWDSDLRVGVLGSGGLSHFVVDEELDRMYLDALRANCLEAHAELPLERLESGNSELRNWSALAGAVEHLQMDLIDYIPCYRTPAGTGCAMAFASWHGPN